MAVTRVKPLYDKNGTLKGYVDKYTGEEFGFPVIVGRKRNPYGKGWVMNSQDAAILLAKDKDIKGETHRVLWFIIGILDFENWVQLSVTEIAKELGMQRPHISRAIKLLEEKEIILRGPKVGRSYAFMLNPDFGWKGKVKNLDDYRKERDEESIQEVRRNVQKKGLKVIENKKREDDIKKIVSLLKKENIDLEIIKKVIEQYE